MPQLSPEARRRMRILTAIFAAILAICMGCEQAGLWSATRAPHTKPTDPSRPSEGDEGIEGYLVDPEQIAFEVDSASDRLKIDAPAGTVRAPKGRVEATQVGVWQATRAALSEAASNGAGAKGRLLTTVRPNADGSFKAEVELPTADPVVIATRFSAAQGEVRLGSAGEARHLAVYKEPLDSAPFKATSSEALPLDPVITYPDVAQCVNPAPCELSGYLKGTLSAQITLARQSFAVGEYIKVRYDGMPGLVGDWITIVPRDFPDNSWCTWQWSTGTTGGQVYSDLPPGRYEVRAYYDWGGKDGTSGGQCEVIARQTFEVTP